MTSSICAITPEGREAQLEDERDSNKYWVGKMKDGNCWMLQNLALGSTNTSMTLTSSDSNVTSNFNLPASLTTATSGGTAATSTSSWNFGKWVLATPLLTTSCGNVTSLASCTKVGFVDISDATKFQPTYTATTRSWEGANANSSTLVAVNCTAWSGSGTSKVCTAGTYDAHYLVGNYYAGDAATASGGGSICPKGWKLPYIPVSGYLTPYDAVSFADLLSEYGVSSSVSGSTYNIAGVPLRFVRSGAIDVSNRKLGVAGQNGYYSSSSSVASNRENVLRFQASDVDPAYNHANRAYGNSVRCVVAGNIIEVPSKPVQ